MTCSTATGPSSDSPRNASCWWTDGHHVVSVEGSGVTVTTVVTVIERIHAGTEH